MKTRTEKAATKKTHDMVVSISPRYRWKAQINVVTAIYSMASGNCTTPQKSKVEKQLNFCC